MLISFQIQKIFAKNLFIPDGNLGLNSYLEKSHKELQLYVNVELRYC